MLENLIGVSILLPFASALLCFLIPSRPLRGTVVVLTAAVLSAVSVLLFMNGPFNNFTPQQLFGVKLETLITYADFALLFIILFSAFCLKHWLAAVLALLQIVPLAWFEFSLAPHLKVSPAFYADNLTLIMVLIISIIGSLICVYAVPYMKEHENHLQLIKTREPKFFFFLVMFLGAMNGLVLSNNLLWLYFFWEITTFCSFMLIGHDGTEQAKANAGRALWMNLLGGVAFMAAIILIYQSKNTLSIQQLIAGGGAAGGMTVTLMAAMGLLCFAGFTKAAQVPFQSWLLGAMIAPTPVSALLHSSTMVKAGVYLIIRIAPIFQDTALSSWVAVFGAFTFLVTSVLALRQNNSKSILAYSTIANLGIIVACAGLNTPAAITAAVVLTIAHAVSKGLMFLCVGTIQQGINTLDIEGMRGLSSRMPVTTVITLIGIVTMLLPPFGVLFGKLIAIESAVNSPLTVVLLIFGSAVTVVFWARWAGLLLTGFTDRVKVPESLSMLTSVPLLVLAGVAILLSPLLPTLYSVLINPYVALYYAGSKQAAQLALLNQTFGGWGYYILFAVMAAAFLIPFIYSSRAARLEPQAPYMSGIGLPPGEGKLEYLGPMNVPVPFQVGNYYSFMIPNQEKFELYSGIISVIIILIMFSGVKI